MHPQPSWHDAPRFKAALPFELQGQKYSSPAPIPTWCPEQELNLHTRKGYMLLRHARLPFRHRGQSIFSVLVAGTGFEPAISGL